MGDSCCPMLDHLQYHPDEAEYIENPDPRATVKEQAQPDGAFIDSEAGILPYISRYINASSDHGVSRTSLTS
jgi:hypothetical protein